MSKKILLPLIAILMCLSLSSCGIMKIAKAGVEATENAIEAQEAERKKAEEEQKRKEEAEKKEAERLALEAQKKADEEAQKAAEEEARIASLKNEIEKGPLIITATGYMSSFNPYYDEGDEDSPLLSYESHQDYLYVAEPGYDALQEAFRGIEKVRYDERQYSKENTDEAVELEYSENNSVPFGLPWNSDYITTIIRNDSIVCSIDISNSMWLGGAHPSYAAVGININPSTGEEYDIKDFVSDYDLLYETVKDYLTDLNENDEYMAGSLYDAWEEYLYDRFYQSEYPLEWTVMDDGLHIFFNPYDLAPWAAGMIEMDLTLEDYPDVLKGNMFYNEYTTVIEHEYPEATTTKYWDEVFTPMSEKIGYLGFFDCVDKLDELQYEYDAGKPYDSETTGDITIEDSESGYKSNLLFWPNSEDNTDPDDVSLYTIWYRGEEISGFVEDHYHEEEVTYYVLNEETKEQVYVDNVEEMARMIFDVIPEYGW